MPLVIMPSTKAFYFCSEDSGTGVFLGDKTLIKFWCDKGTKVNKIINGTITNETDTVFMPLVIMPSTKAFYFCSEDSGTGVFL